jgi:ADP-dependent NAD(P)H-hydrate dehydratase / NAD(P)H-hydrate epimerase
METHPYWHQQTILKPLYPDVEWNKPEQRTQSGRLGIIGGNKLGFAGVGEAYSLALEIGVGDVRALLPDALRKTVPPTITDVLFGATNPSGSLAREAMGEMKALGEWSTGILLIGDAGRNSETAILYEDFVREYEGPLTITRDAFDLLQNTLDLVVERPGTLAVVSFAQLQKMFSKVYYPKILTFSMQLQQLVEALHKFTITYPITVATFHQDTLVVANNGEVTTTPWENPMAIWRGSVATQAMAYWLWNQKQPLHAVTASLVA